MNDVNKYHGNVTSIFRNSTFAQEFEKEVMLRHAINAQVHYRMDDAFGYEDAKTYIDNYEASFQTFIDTIVHKAIVNGIYDQPGIIDLVYQEFNNVVDIINSVIKRSKAPVTKPIIDKHMTNIVSHLLTQMVNDAAVNYNINFSDADLTKVFDKTKNYLETNSADREMVKQFINEELYKAASGYTTRLLQALGSAGFDVVTTSDEIVDQLTKPDQLTRENFQPADNLPKDPWTALLEASHQNVSLKGLVSQLGQFIPQLQVLEENNEDRMVSSADLINEAPEIPSIAQRLCLHRLTSQCGGKGVICKVHPDTDTETYEEEYAKQVLKNRFSGLSTPQLIQQEKNRFLSELADYANVSDGSLEEHVRKHNERLDVINNAARQTIEEHPVEDRPWAFECIKAYARECHIAGELSAVRAVEALIEFSRRLNNEPKEQCPSARLIELHGELGEAVFAIPEFENRKDVLNAIEVVKAKVAELYTFAANKLPLDVE